MLYGSVSHSRCPAHVHQLNGVAERAIRTIMENVRANIEASAAPISFWPHLVEHAIDCLANALTHRKYLYGIPSRGRKTNR